MSGRLRSAGSCGTAGRWKCSIKRSFRHCAKPSCEHLHVQVGMQLVNTVSSYCFLVVVDCIVVVVFVGGGGGVVVFVVCVLGRALTS